MATIDNVPRASSESLEPIKGDSYVVQVGLLYNHYTIKPVDRYTDRPIFVLEKRPPVLKEGIAIINRKFYHVPLQDILRGVVRKSREIKREARNEKSQQRRNSSELQLSDQQGIGEPPSSEERAASDAAWEEQIGALFDVFRSEEGEELIIEEVVQSRPVVEGDSIPD